MNNFLRLNTSIPDEVPPTGSIDIYFDTDLGTIALRNPDRSRITLGGDGGVTLSAGGYGDQDGGKVPTFDADGNIVAAGFSVPNLPESEDKSILGKGTLLLFDGTYSSTALLRTNLTDGSVEIEIGSAGGRLVTENNQTSADDTEAAINGVAVGELYFTGTKFRTRMS